MKRLVPLSLLAVVALVGCGSSESTTTYTEQDIITATDLTLSDTGISYDTPSGCDAAVLLTNKNEVDLYADAGDTVVTNPDGTAGYKTSDDPVCIAEGERNLESLDD